MEANHCLHCVYYYARKACQYRHRGLIRDCLLTAERYMLAAYGFDKV